MASDKTSIGVSKDTRDRLADVAEQMHATSMDEALRIVLLERETALQVAQLEASGEASEYADEMITFATSTSE